MNFRLGQEFHTEKGLESISGFPAFFRFKRNNY